MAKLQLKPTIYRSIPWVLFGVVLMPAVATFAVGIVLLAIGSLPSSIALGVLTVVFAVSTLTGGFITLGLLLHQNKLVRLQTEFIAHVSHELRTPLASIRMYVETLALLIGAYEDVHYPIGPASDGDMLRHLMDARGINQAQLHRATGIAKSTISEVLAGHRPFSKPMIRKLADYFGVDPGVLAANL